MRTANRNIVFLKKAMEQINNDAETINAVIRRVGTPKEIDAYFDIKTIAFGKWLLARNERTLEHSMEELMEAFNDYISSAPDSVQVDVK
jgi:tRNA A37 threonylcarbamoyladenosine dehydratase